MNTREHIWSLSSIIVRLFDEGHSSKEIAFFVMLQLTLVTPGRYTTTTPSESLALMATDFDSVHKTIRSILNNYINPPKMERSLEIGSSWPKNS